MRLPHGHLEASILAAVLAAGAASPRPALADDPAPTQPGVPEVAVERVEPEKKLETLRFLHENRDFFRAQLDLLRQTFGALQYGYGEGLDPRSLKLKALLAEGRAHADSASMAAAQDRTRALLASVAELAELESEMDRMEEMLVSQRDRLARLEDDFTGRQETALVVLLAGAATRPVPEEIVFREAGGDTYRLALSGSERASIAEGGLAQLFHSFVEPRALRYSISCRGEGWSDAEEFAVVVAPERDRLTFLELDFAGFAPGAEEPVRSRIWVW